MLSQYIDVAMSKAVYEKLEDGTYSGVIPECTATIAFGDTLLEQAMLLGGHYALRIHKCSHEQSSI